MRSGLQEYNLLMLSDLHMSEGIQPQSRKYSRKEDFFFDRQFARFLAHYRGSRFQDGRKWHLVILGDCLDLLQVTSYRDAPQELHSDSAPPEYGLDCGEPQAVYKLKKVMEGHHEFFVALAEFVADGNLVTIIKGNHDVEFHYPRVRETFIQELRTVYEDKVRSSAISLSSSKASQIGPTTVFFRDWFYYEKGLLWAEHGNQYDGVNVFKYWLCPLLPEIPKWKTERKDEIDLPWGSLFVRYLFNKIEAVEPFADNIKPQTEFVRWLVLKHPVTVLRFALSDGRYMLRQIRRAWAYTPESQYAARKDEHDKMLKKLAADSSIADETLRKVDHRRAQSILKEPSSRIWRLLRWTVRWRLLLPMVYVLAVLTPVAVLIAVSPLLAVLTPAPIRDFVGSIWGVLTSNEPVLYIVSLIRWFALVPATIVVYEVLRWMFTPEETNNFGGLCRVAQQLARDLHVRYVIMGHTHDASLESIGDNREEYFNTGTWTKVFSEEERLIRPDVEFVFIQGLRKEGDLRLKLMEWDDEAAEPRLLKLFENESDTGLSHSSR